MKVAAVQMTSGPDVTANLEQARVLLEYAAFADFLVERLPRLEQEWNEHRQALRDAGQLPAGPSQAQRTDEEE